MKKAPLFALLSVLSAGMFLFADEKARPTSVHACKATGIDGKTVDLARFEGKALLIVNVASQCGATSQYEGLQALSEHFKEKGLVVLGFPTNDFGAQEPGTNKEILEFCQSNYQVTFPLFAKGPVKGDRKPPLFAYLTSAENPDRTGEIGWNFEKFLVGRDGKLLRRFSTSTTPYDEELVSAIGEALRE